MPFVEKQIEELKQYTGVNPMPEDFDAFWDRSIKEMKEIDANPQWIKSSFQVPFAECFDLFFTGVRGAKIHAKYLRPKSSDAPHPAVIQFHGYGANTGDWNDKLNYVAAGYSVAVLDVRGQGGLSEDLGGASGTTFRGHLTRGLDQGPEYMLFRHIYLDTAQLAGIVMDLPEVDETRVGALGGSQGGSLALACSALEPRIARVAAGVPGLCDYKRVWELDLARDAYDELMYYLKKAQCQ